MLAPATREALLDEIAEAVSAPGRELDMNSEAQLDMARPRRSRRLDLCPVRFFARAVPQPAAWLPSSAPPARETQSSVNFAVGAVPDVMRQSLSKTATFRMTIVPNDSSVPITSAPAVTAT
jgi:hypothetical protein